MDFSNRSYRNSANLQKVIGVLEYYKDRKKRPKIRIHTTLTKDNLAELDAIGKMLTKYDIDLWKIVQFLPENENAIRNKPRLEISEKQFEDAVGSVKKYSKNFRMILTKMKEKGREYFFIQSDGTVFMPVNKKDISIEATLGNIYDKDILEKWKKAVLMKSYANRQRLSRPC